MKFHDTLNDKIWDLNTEDLIPEVKEKLEEIAEAFIEFLEIPTDAVLDKVITGSSASYNYNKYSDLDLHIIVDYDKVHEDCPLVNGYLNSLKKQFNDNHDITIHGVPVELYAEQKDQGTVHNGLYSLQTGWIDKPQKIAPTDNDAAVEAKFNEIKELVDKCDDSEEATELLEKIYNMRKAGLAEAGEFCTENLAFKKLRNEGCMDKLRQIKKEQIDKQLSLESYNEDKEAPKTLDYFINKLENRYPIDFEQRELGLYIFNSKQTALSWDDEFKLIKAMRRGWKDDNDTQKYYAEKSLKSTIKEANKIAKNLRKQAKEQKNKNESIKEAAEGKNYEDGLWEEVESPYFNYDGYIVISFSPVQDFKSGHFMNIREYEYGEDYLADEDFINRIKKYPNENHYVIQCTENGIHYGYIVKRYLTANKNESIKDKQFSLESYNEAFNTLDLYIDGQYQDTFNNEGEINQFLDDNNIDPEYSKVEIEETPKARPSEHRYKIGDELMVVNLATRDVDYKGPLKVKIIAYYDSDEVYVVENDKGETGTIDRNNIISYIIPKNESVNEENEKLKVGDIVDIYCTGQTRLSPKWFYNMTVETVYPNSTAFRKENGKRYVVSNQDLVKVKFHTKNESVNESEDKLDYEQFKIAKSNFGTYFVTPYDSRIGRIEGKSAIIVRNKLAAAINRYNSKSIAAERKALINKLHKLFKQAGIPKMQDMKSSIRGYRPITQNGYYIEIYKGDYTTFNIGITGNREELGNKIKEILNNEGVKYTGSVDYFTVDMEKQDNKNESIKESEETKYVEDPKELNPKYTVGDYVRFYDTYDQTNKIGKIIRINVSEIPDDTTLYYTSYQIEYYIPKGVKLSWGGKSSGQFFYAQMVAENRILSLVSEEEYQKSCFDNISQANDTETYSVAEYVFDVEYEDTQADEWGDGFTSGTLTITKWNDGTYSWYADDIDDGDDGLKSIAQCKKAYKDYLKEGGFRKIRITQNESLNKLEETLKRVKDMEINEGMWASPFTMENAKQIAELLSKPITYEELNSEEGKQKYWNIIGDDEFWDNVDDEAFYSPEEDVRYLIVKFLEDWMERKESFNDDAYSQEAENIIKKAIFMFNGITEDMATLEKKVDAADNDLHDIITSLENSIKEALE